MPLTPGTTLGPYEIQAPLGAGGQREVYKALSGLLPSSARVMSESGTVIALQSYLRPLSGLLPSSARVMSENGTVIGLQSYLRPL